MIEFMAHLIDKDALVAEIERLKTIYNDDENIHHVARYNILVNILSFIGTLEVIDPYEQRVQYDSIKSGIQAQAETYSFNIESGLYNQQTTKEGQELWRKEIKEAYIRGGEVGVELARDPRYKENLEAKEMKEYEQPEHSYFETTYKCGKKPHWNVGDTLAYYEFCSDIEGEIVLGKIINVGFDKEQGDWIYTFEDGRSYDEELLLEDETYKKK